jgi:hypothetical protein
MAKSDYVKLDVYCNDTTDLSTAITNALTSGLGPSGGTIDATNVDSDLMKFRTTVNVKKPLTLLLGAGKYEVAGTPPPDTLFDIKPMNASVSFRLTGVDSTATMIKAAATGTTLFKLGGNILKWTGHGSPYFCLQRVKLDGNSNSSIMLSTSGGAPTLSFEDGLLVVEDCLITNFGGRGVGAAIQIGPSIYYNRFHRNMFINNYQAIYLDNNTEASITENNFLQGLAGGATLTLVGPMHRVVHNYFYRNKLSDSSNEPDILLLPQGGRWNGQAGGYVWIEDNRFGGEHENLDPRRTRIKLFSQSDARLIGGPVIVRANQFNGPSAGIKQVTGDGSSATVTLVAEHTTQGLTPGTIVIIRGTKDSNFNGTFAVQAVVDNSTFKYDLAYIGNSSKGTVYLASSDSRGFIPMDIISASRKGTLVTIKVVNTTNLTEGGVVTINDAGDANFNGTYSITEVGDGKFMYTLLADPDPTVGVSPEVTGGVVYATNGGAITLLNPHLAWDVSGNSFANYQTLINDYQTQVAQTGYGQSLFLDNRVHSGPQLPGYQVFANEGRNFTVVRVPSDAPSPANTTLGALDSVPRRNETRSLQNRIAWSADLQAWTPRSIAVSPLMDDPLGSQRAFKLALSGTSGNIAQKIEIDTPPRKLAVGSRLVIKFWAKRGTLSMLRVGVLQVNSQQWHGNLFTASLGSDWRQYKFVTNGLVSVKDVFSLCFYPGDSEQITGDIFLFAPQVSDDDVDYYPTREKWVHDPSAGNRFEQAPVITSLKTMTNTGAALPAPKSTWVESNAPNATTGTASLDPGSSDFAGVIQLKVMNGKPTCGTVEVTYAKAYLGMNSPVVVACLVDRSGAWAGSAAVRLLPAQSSEVNLKLVWTNFTLSWTDSAGLTPGKTYGLNYIVIGRT